MSRYLLKQFWSYCITFLILSQWEYFDSPLWEPKKKQVCKVILVATIINVSGMLHFRSQTNQTSSFSQEVIEKVQFIFFFLIEFMRERLKTGLPTLNSIWSLREEGVNTNLLSRQNFDTYVKLYWNDQYREITRQRDF